MTRPEAPSGLPSVARDDVTVLPREAAQQLHMSPSRIQHLSRSYWVRVSAERERFAADLLRGMTPPRPVDLTQHIGELACYADEYRGPKQVKRFYHVYLWGIKQYTRNPTGVGRPAGTVMGPRKAKEAAPPQFSLSAQAQGVSFTSTRMQVELRDTRRLSVPLAWFPRLQRASHEEREQWRLIANGEAIHWDALDEEISVPRLLGLV